MEARTFEAKPAPDRLLAPSKEIDDKTSGAGFDCFATDAVCDLGVADRYGREAIRAKLRAFIEGGFTAPHEVKEDWDGGGLKVFRGMVLMTHFFEMDEAGRVERWYGAVG